MTINFFWGKLLLHAPHMYNCVCLPFHTIINCHWICMLTHDRVKWLCQSLLKIYQIRNWWKMEIGDRNCYNNDDHDHDHDDIIPLRYCSIERTVNSKNTNIERKDHAHYVNYNIICIDCIKLTNTGKNLFCWCVSLHIFSKQISFRLKFSIWILDWKLVSVTVVIQSHTILKSLIRSFICVRWLGPMLTNIKPFR